MLFGLKKLFSGCKPSLIQSFVVLIYKIYFFSINVKNLQFACNISLTYANKRLSVKTLKTNYFLGGFKVCIIYIFCKFYFLSVILLE